MSHFTVMVIGDSPEEQLEKYDESLEAPEYCRGEVPESEKNDMLNYYSEKYGFKGTFDECYDKHGESWNRGHWRKDDNGLLKEYSTYNPDSKWDWYQLGGRWSGSFIKLKKGATGFLGERSLVAGNEAGVDQAYLKDIDFEAIEKEARDSANKQYSEVASLFEDNTIPRLEILWKDMFKEGSEYKDLPVEKKREIYHSQKALKIAREKISNPFFELEKYQCSQEEYVKREVSCSFSPFAIVKDGEWFEKGEMGWFAIVSNEKHQEDWDKEVLEMIKELPEDTLISFFDCHI